MHLFFDWFPFYDTVEKEVVGKKGTETGEVEGQEDDSEATDESEDEMV
jgi:ribosome biogenesis protein SSF1/2